ncbi:MAG: MotA/TolQ/ExbB proton channel family protein [Acidobacteria bacterium]|nr:MAG: MotA/TolQ/ExbB proton channel family protein [Acidobacteriota bacterium]
MLLALGQVWTYFKQGGPIMWPLLICSILGLIFVIERAISYYRIKGEASEIFSAVREALLAGDLRRAIEITESYTHPVAATLKAGLLRYGRSTEEIERAMEVVALHEVSRLERNLWILATVANIAPLFGFLGTVTGMIGSFEALAEVGLGNPKAVAAGISEALITTAAGLMIALPVQYAFNHFTNRVNHFTLGMETSAAVLLETFSEARANDEPGQQKRAI